MRERQSDYYLM